MSDASIEAVGETVAASDLDDLDAVLVNLQKPPAAVTTPPPKAPVRPAAKSAFPSRVAILLFLLPVILSIVYERSVSLSVASIHTHTHTQGPPQPSPPAPLPLPAPPSNSHQLVKNLDAGAKEVQLTLATFARIYAKCLSTTFDLLVKALLPPKVQVSLREAASELGGKIDVAVIRLKESDEYKQLVTAVDDYGKQLVTVLDDYSSR